MFVDTIGRGLDIVAAVDSPGLRLLADVYHSAQTNEDLATAIGDRMRYVGHVQVADTPGRHEPGTGTIAWPALPRTAAVSEIWTSRLCFQTCPLSLRIHPGVGS